MEPLSQYLSEGKRTFTKNIIFNIGMEICCGLNGIGPGPISEVRCTPVEQAYVLLDSIFDHTKNFVSTQSAHPEEFLLKTKNPNFGGLPRCTGNFSGESLVKDPWPRAGTP